MLQLCVWELWFEAVLLQAFLDSHFHACHGGCCGPGYLNWINGVCWQLPSRWQAPLSAACRVCCQLQDKCCDKAWEGLVGLSFSLCK